MDPFDDAEMWTLLGIVVASEDKEPMTKVHPPRSWERLERAGLVWIRPRGAKCHYYQAEPTPQGSVAAHRWAQRCAKNAALEFGRCAR